MSATFTTFDAAEYLDSDEAIAAYMNEVIAEGDDDLFLSALSDIARARGMTKIAEDSGLGRESLYKALRPGAKPGFFTIAKVVAALGVNLRVATKAAKPLKTTKPNKSDVTARSVAGSTLAQKSKKSATASNTKKRAAA
jgi:probable addiction module antidote protein